jgi:dethiobiotin synthetase
MKPVAAGADATPQGLRNTDALQLMRAANVDAPYERVNPFCFPLPASPHIAARSAGIGVDLAVIRRDFEILAGGTDTDVVVVEGAGGWLAPISEAETMADVAQALKLPIVLIVGLRLGCLNHALLTAQAIEAAGMPLVGWIANHVQPRFEHADENIALLTRRLSAPLLESVAFDASGRAHPFGGASAARLREALRL